MPKKTLEANQYFLETFMKRNLALNYQKKHDLWFDFGIMESNIGFESIRGSQRFTMKSSLMAESSPYYLNAEKLRYTTKIKKWEIELLLSNGWQQMVNVSLQLAIMLSTNLMQIIKSIALLYWELKAESFLETIHIILSYK